VALLRDLVNAALGQPCPYCPDVLDHRNFSVDHSEPISRGGSFALDELCIICLRCNQVKGNMNEGEFTRLLWLLKEFHPDAARNLLARLRAGGRITRA
jgi:5-methylcytosine-specific restriction endonuclease McrA